MRSRKGDGELGLSYSAFARRVALGRLIRQAPIGERDGPASGSRPTRAIKMDRELIGCTAAPRADFGRVGEACMLFEHGAAAPRCSARRPDRPLYQLPLDEFTAARNALAKESGAAGAEIRALQKPPVAAWAINQVYWRGRPAFHAFNASAAALRAAHTGVVSGKRADLRAASKAHEEALEAVAKAALAILRDAGQPATDATKQAILTTLRALPASSDPPGRLTQVLQPTGFELLAGLPAAPAVAARSAPARQRRRMARRFRSRRMPRGRRRWPRRRRQSPLPFARSGQPTRKRAARNSRPLVRPEKLNVRSTRSPRRARPSSLPRKRSRPPSGKPNGHAQEGCVGTARTRNRRRARGGEGSHRGGAGGPHTRLAPNSMGPAPGGGRANLSHANRLAAMHDPRVPARHVKFGPFELDLRSSELRKGPTRLKVPDQSIEILKALLHQPGELVTREQLRERLWPSNTFVDFEHGLNAAIRRLREALGDSADTPRYIERCPVAATGSLALLTARRLPFLREVDLACNIWRSRSPSSWFLASDSSRRAGTPGARRWILRRR